MIGERKQHVIQTLDDMDAKSKEFDWDSATDREIAQEQRRQRAQFEVIEAMVDRRERKVMEALGWR